MIVLAMVVVANRHSRQRSSTARDSNPVFEGSSRRAIPDEQRLGTAPVRWCAGNEVANHHGRECYQLSDALSQEPAFFSV